MKKTLLTLIAAITFLSPMKVSADEGMWTLFNLPQLAYEQMKAEGFTMPYEDLYASPNAIKNFCVNFSGYCSGVVVSPNGLVFTNHHCGFESIRSHSTVEHDYMLNGFYAKSYEEELPNENMFVAFMRSEIDITDRLEALNIHSLTTERQSEVIDSIEAFLNDSVKNVNKHLFVEVKPFYEGNSYYASIYQSYPDVRLVFTIPKSMGKFGGETDNWMWPRQTCDYSVFRVYADKDGNPAPYSKDNVPYHPKAWAPVSMDGYKQGDFAMTIGYPGSTERYLSSYGIKEMRDCVNDPRQQVRGVRQEVMLRHMRASEAVRIKYDSKYAQSSNYWKNAIGMNKCIDSIGIVSQKRDFETRIAKWMESDECKIKDKLTSLNFDSLASMYARRAEAMRTLTILSETFPRSNELTARAIRYCMGRTRLQGPKEKPKNQYVVFDDNSDEYDVNCDLEMLIALMKNYREQVPEKYLPSFYNIIDKRFGGDCAAYVNYVWNKSVLMKSGKKIFVNKASTLKDPGVMMGLDIVETQMQLMAAYTECSEEIENMERLLCLAKVRMEEDLPHYSDANFTMRLSYGQVGGYDIGGYDSGYYTEASSIVKKMDLAAQNFEYEAEPIMRELMSAADFGEYTDKTTGKMHLCFLTNNDITGGNSGSPMFNGKGELIGLAFDGNWDSLSSDIFFDKKLARCIGVDIRYVLYLMDKWGKADRLIKEIFQK
ncbi:MAG: S46 family peptidase [Prevotella sp.]|nr:S46 family peptidase [Prevotella sp.]